MSGQLAKMVREKHPGAYDDLTDDQLERSVIAKFPGVYDDLMPPVSRTDAAMDVMNWGPKGQAAAAAARDQYIALGPGRVKTGFERIGRGEFSGGAHDILLGGAMTALPMVAGPLVRSAIAAPLSFATRMGLGGTAAMATQAVGPRVGLSEDQSALTGDVAGMVAGGPVASRAIASTKRGTQLASQKLYERIFPKTDNEVIAAERAAAARQLGQDVSTPETVAQSMRERGVYGRPAEQGGQLRNRLDAVEAVLQDEASQVSVRLPDRSSYIKTLSQIAQHYKGQDFASERDGAIQLAREIADAPGGWVEGRLALRLRRFLDGQRRSFDEQKVVGPAQANLRDASNLLRSRLHENPRLSPLISEEERLLKGMERTAYWGGKPSASPSQGDVVALGMGSAPAVMASAAQRFLKAPTASTSIGQALHWLSGGGVAPTIPALPERIPLAGLLRAGRGIGPAPDSSFVQSVPGEYARRDVRGLLEPWTPPVEGIPLPAGVGVGVPPRPMSPIPASVGMKTAGARRNAAGQFETGYRLGGVDVPPPPSISVPARYTLQRDPRTGRARKVYTGEVMEPRSVQGRAPDPSRVPRGAVVTFGPDETFAGQRWTRDPKTDKLIRLP